MSSEMENPFLPFEIITNILTRLPIKSIVKFQCVCKAWKHLFKTQSFISQHTLHSSHQNPFLLIHAYDHDHHQRSTLRLLNHNMQTTEVLNTHLIDSFTRGWRIVGSSNGLLCVELQTDFRRLPISYLVWNPVSNEVKKVPQILYDCGDASRVGFGYSSVVNDYKIVTFYNPHLFDKRETHAFGGILCCVQVYSLNTGLWKKLEMVKDVQNLLIDTEAATLNGTIFWKGDGSERFSGLPIAYDLLIAFDIATEVFTVTRTHNLLANVGVDGDTFLPSRPFEYGNKLAMCDAMTFVALDQSESYNMRVWVIEDEEGAGVSGKSYRCIERFNFGPILRGLQPLCFWRNEIVCRYEVSEEAEAEGDEKNYLHLFNLTTKEWKKVKIPNFSGHYQRCAVFNYERTLCAYLRRTG